MASTLFILYVADQEASRDFYTSLLGVAPVLDVPGMTEIPLPGGALLGLMPEQGIRALLGEALPDPAAGSGIPRAELYLIVDDARAFHLRSLALGAKELDPLRQRGWGQRAAYSVDRDGHVIAFAEEL